MDSKAVALAAPWKLTAKQQAKVDEAVSALKLPLHLTFRGRNPFARTGL